jgi:hypothetical protein
MNLLSKERKILCICLPSIFSTINEENFLFFVKNDCSVQKKQKKQLLSLVYEQIIGILGASF